MSTFRFEKSEDSPGFVLWQLSNRWQQHMRAVLSPLGLTHVQFVLLASTAWLEAHSVTITQVTLAHHAQIDVMMTSQVVRTLEEKGLITRAPQLTDTRAKVVSLTDAGRILVQQATAQVEEADAQFFAPLAEQVSAFVATMNRLVQAANDTAP